MLLGHVAIFGCGLLHLYAYFNFYVGVETTWRAALSVGLLPFIPSGVVKLVLAVSVARTLSKYMRLEAP